MPNNIDYDSLYSDKTEYSNLPLPKDYYKQVVDQYDASQDTGEFSGDIIKSKYDKGTTVYQQQDLSQLRLS